MANIDPLLERNREFATTGVHEGLTILAHHQVYVMTCLDPRVDPSQFFKLGPGDAMVTRNAGGRVTPDALNDLAYIGYLFERVVPDGPRFEVAVVHHTNCGTGYLGDEKIREGFAARIGVDEAALAAKAVVDPAKTVHDDVELLRSSTTVLPATITVSGHVYDVSTGLVTTVIPAAPMHTDAAAR
jgi:carbonic anhydrase